MCLVYLFKNIDIIFKKIEKNTSNNTIILIYDRSDNHVI